MLIKVLKDCLAEKIKLQNRLSQNRVLKCDCCKESIAMASCCECGGVLLSATKLIKIFHWQTIITIHFVKWIPTRRENPALISDKSPLCQKHPQELLKLCCQDCEMLVCYDCVLITHRSYNYSYIDEVFEKEKANLKAIT